MQIIEVPRDDLWFLVRSESGPGHYSVDLRGRNGNGECTCIDFATRAPQAERVGRVHQCKHIEACSVYVYFRHLRRMMDALADFRRTPRAVRPAGYDNECARLSKAIEDFRAIPQATARQALIHFHIANQQR